MTSFKVLTLGEFMIGKNVEIAIRAFATFYHDLTSKHQKKCSLIIIEKEEFIKSNLDIANKYEVADQVKFIPWTEQEDIQKAYKESTLMLLPTRASLGRIIPEAYSFSLLILSYDCDEITEFVDMTCGLLADFGSNEQNILAFSDTLRILYFDPEGTKLLKKGALRKYETSYSWGLKKMLKSS